MGERGSGSRAGRCAECLAAHTAIFRHACSIVEHSAACALLGKARCKCECGHDACKCLNPVPQVWRAGSSGLMVRAPATKATFVLRALQPADAAALQRLHDDIARSSRSGADGAARRQDAQQPAAGEQRQRQGGGSHFDQKTEKGSADLYFHYYGELASPGR